MKTAPEVEAEMARVRSLALKQVVPGDEQSSALHAWLALAWVLDVQQEEITKLLARVVEVEQANLSNA
jgi:hypothetical protein